jgi:1,4-dihydroxy-2-naphthoate octaprenyltransferase
MTANLIASVRAGEWWDYKLVPLLTAFYATVALLDRPVASLWPAALTLLLALVPGAAFVSLLNDLTDLDEDRAAGKPNRMAGRPSAFRIAAILLPVTAGILFLWLWRDDPLLMAVYLAAWIAFTLYSLPPFRLKARGFWGVLADASGAHLFPTLVAILVAFRAAERPLDPVWVAAGAAWAFGYGLRGILWHQLSDRDNDRAAGVRTFAQRHPRRVSARVGAWLAFPLELIGLGLLVWKLGSPLPLLFLGLYLLLLALRIQRWLMHAVIVDPQPKYLILLHEYYDVFLPLAILLTSAKAFPIDWLVVAAHLLAFNRRPRETVEDVRTLWRFRGYPFPSQEPGNHSR